VASKTKQCFDDNGSELVLATPRVSKMRASFRCAKRIPVRPLISAIYDELVTRHGDVKRIDLDDIDDVIGARAVTYEEVEYLVDRLEAAGFSVGEGIEAPDVEIMQLVLMQARSLQLSLGRKPTIDEIASASSKPSYVVRRALERATGKLRPPV
jgi:hypothetical protein